MQKQQIQLDLGIASYWEAGEGEPLVFLHGFLGSGENWRSLLDHLTPHFRCLAIDLLGFGGSSKPRLQYTIWHQVEFLQQLMVALNLPSVHWVGHSYGGWVTTAYALAASGLGWTEDKTAWSETITPTFLKLPKSLTLIAPAGIRDDQFVGRYQHLKPLLWETPLVDGVLKLLIWVASIFKHPEKLTEIATIRENLVNQPVAKSFLLDRLRPEDAIDTVESYLDRLQIPTQVIAGANDNTIPLWHCQTYAEGIKEAKLTVIDQAGHDLLQAHPQVLASLIEKMIALRLEQATGNRK
jgi:pimeloyl-ACP methyl ester carboxylesterase